jgi:L,D-peptidoglycan transpeptidase YkuD (ErfK/YbiS/YcfS/YnhG family)
MLKMRERDISWGRSSRQKGYFCYSGQTPAIGAYERIMHCRTNRTKPAGLALLRVARRIGGRPHEGRLIAGTLVLPCALGRSGISRRKREGDGASPAGRWPLLYFYLRAPNPLRLRWRRTRPHDLWCDDPRSFL